MTDTEKEDVMNLIGNMTEEAMTAEEQIKKINEEIEEIKKQLKKLSLQEIAIYVYQLTKEREND